MKSELNSKEYVTFARKFVKDLVGDMEIEELRSIVSDRIHEDCLLYTSPSPRDRTRSRMPSSA